MGRPLLFVSAGDPSGDNATSHLISSLKRLRPDVELIGLGGPKLKALGQEQFADGADLAVLGFWEVAKRFSFFRRLLSTCAKEIEKRRPSCVLLVDYPGFNLRLAERVKPLGIPIVYYISPQVWAWGVRRIPKLKRLTDRILVILPFEEKFFEQHGIPVTMVGHYLMDDIPAEFINSPIPENKQIALLPGSRQQEVQRMLEPMLAAARKLYREQGYKAVIAAVRNGYDYDRHLRDSDSDGITLSYDDARRIIFDSKYVLTASGTATLETGIIGRPMVVVYKTGWVTYHIARRLVKLDKIALVNLVLGEKAVPELIQADVTGDRLHDEMMRYIEDKQYASRVKTALARVPELLGGQGASERAAEWVSKCL